MWVGRGDCSRISVEEGVQAKLKSTREPRLRMNESLEMTGMAVATSGRKLGAGEGVDRNHKAQRRRPKASLNRN